MIKTRFAPSPTGYLHVGGLRTALYAFLLAKSNDGQFILRIEDTDQERLVSGSQENLIKTLEWADLKIDDGPFVQSERLHIYKEYADKLINDGHAYRCFCTRERLTEMRETQMQMKKAPMYDRKCRYLSESEIQENLNNKTPFVIRQSIPLNRLVKFTDAVRGKTTFDTNTLDDQVLLKSDGFPTYHLAVVVDDHLMEITHVIRGEEWLPSTPKHILLYESFGWEPPTFAHLSLLLNKDRQKLSKRHNDVSVEQYIEKGYSKEALINFIALLGWNTSDNQEIYSLQELIENFSLDRVQKAGAIFDVEKLNWFQWQWNRRKYLEKLSEIAKEIDPNVEIIDQKKGKLDFKFSNKNSEALFTIQRGDLLKEYTKGNLSENILKKQNDNAEFFAKALISLEEKILKEPENTVENIGFYFNENLQHKKNLFEHEKMQVNIDISLQSVIKSIESLKEDDFESEEYLKNKFIKIIESLELKNGQVLWPIRVALTAEEFSPGAFEVAYALGYEKTIKRLIDAKDYLTKLKEL